MIDFFLLFASLLISIFGVYLIFFSRQNLEDFESQGFVIFLLGLLLLYAAIDIPSEQFNPETDDCFSWESKDKYSNQDYDTCKIWALSQKVDDELLCKREFFYNCVSWQPKKQEIDSLLNLSCQKLVALHNKRVDVCMFEAEKGMEEGYYSRSKFDDCYPLAEKSRILSAQDLKCDEEFDQDVEVSRA